MKRRVGLDIYITASQLCVINHTAETGKDRVEKKESGQRRRGEALH